MTDKIRLNAYISKSGYCSRRKADDLIEIGKVRVDGELITSLGEKVSLDSVVTVDDEKIKIQEKFQYIAFNKPRLSITSKFDDKERDTIYKFLPDNLFHLNSVGRLDYDTSGLLLLTNDGDLLYKLTHPKFKVKRIYRITCNLKISNYQIETLQKGVRLSGGVLSKADEAYKQGDYLFLTLHEGRYHHVKRMVEAVGNKVHRMKRIEYAGIGIKGMKPGIWRSLGRAEIMTLKRLGR